MTKISTQMAWIFIIFLFRCHIQASVSHGKRIHEKKGLLLDKQDNMTTRYNTVGKAGTINFRSLKRIT
jgi:hypothetical protein